MKLAALAATLLAASMLTAMPAYAAGSKPAAQAAGGAGNSHTNASTDDSSTDDTSVDDTSTDDTSVDDTTDEGSDTVVTAENPQSVLDALSAAGYRAKLDKMESGRTSIAVTISGLKTFIDFYDCADDLTDCYTLLFNVSLDLKDGATQADVNDWNSKQITGRVWLDNSSDPTLDFSLSTFEGLSPSVFDQNLKLWDTKIGDFKDAFHF